MRKGKRLTALLLALVLCLSVLPANVLATELGSEAETAEVAAPEGTGEVTETEEPQVAETEEPDEEPVEDVSPSSPFLCLFLPFLPPRLLRFPVPGGVWVPVR